MLLVSRETSLGVLLFKSTYVTILAVCVTVSPSFMRFVNLTAYPDRRGRILIYR